MYELLVSLSKEPLTVMTPDFPRTIKALPVLVSERNITSTVNNVVYLKLNTYEREIKECSAQAGLPIKYRSESALGQGGSPSSASRVFPVI